jgi:hypothetical protein
MNICALIVELQSYFIIFTVMYKLIIFFLLFAISCESGETKRIETPPIPKDEMIQIMVDLAISAAMVENELLGTNPLIYQKKLGFYDDIFGKYGYSSEEVTLSFELYSENLLELDAMYDVVIEELSKQEIELNKTR